MIPIGNHEHYNKSRHPALTDGGSRHYKGRSLTKSVILSCYYHIANHAIYSSYPIDNPNTILPAQKKRSIS